MLKLKINKWGYGFVWYRLIWNVGVVVVITKLRLILT